MTSAEALVCSARLPPHTQAVRKLADTKKLESQLNSEWTDSK